MATSYSLFAPDVERRVLACERGPDLIGHIIERELRYEAYCWPHNTRIGTYESCAEAAATLDAHRSTNDGQEEMSSPVTTQPCPSQHEFAAAGEQR